MDAVSERWLLDLDEILESICRKRQDPRKRIHEWALEIHRAKVEKVCYGPELYKSFDLAAKQSKPFVKCHLDIIHQQLLGLVKEAVAKIESRNADPEEMTQIISSAVVAFHHPRLVAHFIDVNRENLLRQVIDTVLKGLHLKT